MANKKISQLTNSLTKATVATADVLPIVDTSASETKKITYQELIQPQDNQFRIAGSSDNTKLVAFEVDGLTTATTRTLTVPDANTTLVGTDTTQTLTNKTLTSPQINFGSDATGDIYYRTSGGVTARLPIGTAGQIIQVSSGGIPEYVANPAAADASTTIKGVVEEATQAETNAGTSAGGTGARLFVNPSTLQTWLQSQNVGTLAVASGENLTAGVPVYINPSDSSVYTSHGFKSLDSTTLNLAAAPTTSHKTAKLSDTQMMYLTDNGTTTLTINVFDINSAASVATATVTTSFDQTTDSTPTLPSATMCRLSDTTFVVFYARTTDNNLYFRTGSISGATITMDTETAYSGTPTWCYGMTAVPGASAGKVVFSYFDMTQEITTGGDSAQVLSYLTVSTNSVSVDTTVSYTLSSAGYNVTPQWSNCCFTNGIAYGLYSCKDGGGIAEVSYNYINVNNSVTASNQYTLNLESQTGTGTSAAYATIIPFLAGHDGKGYFGWATSDGTSVNTKTVLEISQVGCKIAYQATTIRSAGDTTISALKIFGNECGVIASGFADSITGAYYNGSIYIQKGKVYGFYSGDTLGIRADIPQAQAWYSNSKDEVVVCYLDNSANGFIKQWKLPTPVAGLVTSAVTAPASAVIYNNTATTSGLTANAPYFLKDTYTTIGDMSNTGTIPVGQALSTTVMKLNG